jgi:hypothetical protein
MSDLLLEGLWLGFQGQYPEQESKSNKIKSPPLFFVRFLSLLWLIVSCCLLFLDFVVLLNTVNLRYYIGVRRQNEGLRYRQLMVFQEISQ